MENLLDWDQMGIHVHQTNRKYGKAPKGVRVESIGHGRTPKLTVNLAVSSSLPGPYSRRTTLRASISVVSVAVIEGSGGGGSICGSSGCSSR